MCIWNKVYMMALSLCLCVSTLDVTSFRSNLILRKQFELKLVCLRKTQKLCIYNPAVALVRGCMCIYMGIDVCEGSFQ